MHTLHPLKVFVIPGWIYKALQRNNINIIDIHNFSTCRHVLSLDDMAEWLCVNDSPIFEDSWLSTGSFMSQFNGLQPAEREEINNVITALGYSEATLKSVTSRLSNSSPYTKSYYQIITQSGGLYVVLNEGFFNEMTNLVYRENFIKNYLKACQVLLPLHEVARLAIFKKYLDLFKV